MRRAKVMVALRRRRKATLGRELPDYELWQLGPVRESDAKRAFLLVG